jgi:hypothetical protein
MHNGLKSPWITFWPWWLLANLISFYFIMGIFAVPSTGTSVGAGVLLALLQWLLLRRYMGVDYTWFAAGIVVYAIFFTVVAIWGVTSFAALLSSCILCLGLPGLLQLAVLRNYADDPGLWLIASPGAAVLAAVIILMLRPGAGYQVHTFWLIMGVTYGAITGAAILWLKQRTKRYVDDAVPPWKRA